MTRGVKDVAAQPYQYTINIEDGNATFYCMKDVLKTFQQIGLKILNMSTAWKSKVIFSTDMYTKWKEVEEDVGKSDLLRVKTQVGQGTGRTSLQMMRISKSW